MYQRNRSILQKQPIQYVFQSYGLFRKKSNYVFNVKQFFLSIFQREKKYSVYGSLTRLCNLYLPNDGRNTDYKSTRQIKTFTRCVLQTFFFQMFFTIQPCKHFFPDKSLQYLPCKIFLKNIEEIHLVNVHTFSNFPFVPTFSFFSLIIFWKLIL